MPKNNPQSQSLIQSFTWLLLYDTHYTGNKEYGKIRHHACSHWGDRLQNKSKKQWEEGQDSKLHI